MSTKILEYPDYLLVADVVPASVNLCDSLEKCGFFQNNHVIDNHCQLCRGGWHRHKSRYSQILRLAATSE